MKSKPIEHFFYVYLANVGCFQDNNRTKLIPVFYNGYIKTFKFQLHCGEGTHKTSSEFASGRWGLCKRVPDDGCSLWPRFRVPA